MSAKQLAEKSGLPEKTVTRVLSGKTENPYIDTLSRIVTALGCTLTDILADTKVVVGDKSMAQMQEEIDGLNAKIEELTAQLELYIKDNAIQIEKVSVLTKELELVNLKLMYTEKLLATHDYYNKLVKD
jgi:transcriptional regulator with XRE-family HTH domain